MAECRRQWKSATEIENNTLRGADGDKDLSEMLRYKFRGSLQCTIGSSLTTVLYYSLCLMSIGGQSHVQVLL